MATKQEYLDKAFEILKNSGEILSGPELKSRITSIATGIADAYGDAALFQEIPESPVGFPEPVCDPRKAIRDSTITCCVCGQAFKLLTAKHLASHNMTAKEYKAAYGYRSDQSLCCKDLKKMRAEKMKELELWKRKGSAKAKTTTAANGKSKSKSKEAPSNSLPENAPDMAAATV